MKLLIPMLAVLVLLGAAAHAQDQDLYLRLEDANAWSGLSEGAAPTASDDVPLAVIPLTNAANHASAVFDGKGHLRVKSSPMLSTCAGFTVEMWARFRPLGAKAEILASKGKLGPSNWHIIYQTDGTVQANVFGRLTYTYFFDAASGGPMPGVWYHLAATYEDIGGGRTRIRTYVNGQPRGMTVGPSLQDTSGTDLFIGSYVDGELPFRGSMDEFRFTPKVLKPGQLLIAGSQQVVQSAGVPRPAFVAAGTRVTAEMRAKGAPVLAKPSGYPYFYAISTGSPMLLPSPPDGYDPAFCRALQGWPGNSLAGYHFAVKPNGKFVVAIGFYDPDTEPGKRPIRVAIDGKTVDSLDAAKDGNKLPFIRKYEARDENGDGLLEVSCYAVNDEMSTPARVSVVYVFPEESASSVDTGRLVRGDYDVPPIYLVRCGREEEMRGHIDYPKLSAATRKKMQPMRPVPFDRVKDWPQPADPLDVTVKGELADRINTYMDRWGFSGRDEQLVARHLPDCGYEVTGREIETFYMLSRLMHRDFDLRVPFDALMERQDKTSKFPGSFVGGNPVRTGFIWSQGTDLSGIMGYHELTGDPRALDAAGKLADWYQSYLDNGDLWAANYFFDESRFKRDGATVGHLGKGALEPMVWLYWRTRNPEYLHIAKEMAELNRQWGGVAWMIHGDLPPERQQYEGWHIHANLTTVRGFPWLYAATGDRSYLNDAIAACDRVFDRATWCTGGVTEQIPWAGTQFPGATPDPHDEICQTADELMLSYVLGDFTMQGRFFDRGEFMYYNHIRYSQLHNGDFTAFNRLPGPTRGGDAWFCCGWWGGKALYEVARHLYASSPTCAYVNGFMPSSVDLKLHDGSVRLTTEADIPKTGHVRLRVSPSAAFSFDLKIRVPGWAQLGGIAVNGEAQTADAEAGYATMHRQWKPGDIVDIDFRLPLRVVTSSCWDTLPAAKVSLNGASPTDSRYISVLKGPVILAQFRLAHGCDLNWIYTGDHPDLLDTLDTCSDSIDAGDWSFQTDAAPRITKISETPDGVGIQSEFTPKDGWTLRKTAIVHPGVPVKVDLTSELIAPSEEAAMSVKSAKLCGVRMRTGGFVDYKKATLRVDGKIVDAIEASDRILAGRRLSLDNGYIRLAVTRKAGQGALVSDEGTVECIYAGPTREGNTLKASCTLDITGKNQFAMPMMRGGK